MSQVLRNEQQLGEVVQEVQITKRNLDSVLSKVTDKMKQFETLINEVKASNMKAEIPLEIVNFFNAMIQESALSLAVQDIRKQVRELCESVQNDRFVTDGLRGIVVNLLELFDNVILSPHIIFVFRHFA